MKRKLAVVNLTVSPGCNWCAPIVKTVVPVAGSYVPSVGVN